MVMVVRFNAVPMTIPSISPMAHPVRQCKVACAAAPHVTVFV